MSSPGSCLVARAVPLPKSASELQEGEKSKSSVDSLVNNLTNLEISPKKASASSPKDAAPKTRAPGARRAEMINPAEFFSSQSMNSSIMAGKTKTTTKVTQNSNLMADLLSFGDESAEREEKVDESKADKPVEAEKKPVEKEEEKKVEKKEPKKDSNTVEKPEESKDELNKSKQDENLLPRGPVRSTRTPADVNFHPYPASGGVHPNYGGNTNLPYGTAPQSTVTDPSVFNPHNTYAYECGVPYYNNEGREYLSNSSTPDTVNSDLGYGSATSPPQMLGGGGVGARGSYGAYGTTPYHPGVGLDELCSGMKMCSGMSRLEASNSTELPDALSDFILKYSRRYTPSVDGCCSRKTSVDTLEGGNTSPTKGDVGSNSLCNSPLSAGSAPRNSPSAPYGGVSDQSGTPPSSAKLQSRCAQFVGITCGDGAMGMKPQVAKRPAKERLRALIDNEAMDEAWAWTCKFIQESSECLSYQDNTGDTLLHIVVCQPYMDLAKIYALVEQMLKMESEFANKPFDVPNQSNETPLFLAVEKRHNEVVDYLLEAGSNPNAQNSRSEREAPLHYAAARGMNEVVQTLCSYSGTNLNMLNGMGLTPLLCAVKNHGVLEEESQSLIDNKVTIQLLLKYGADPAITDATNGKSVIMYAVEGMNSEIIEIFQSNLTEEKMAQLVNKPDLCNDTPMSTLQTLNVDQEAKSNLGLTLITCGADSHGN